jgi:hypothetical protein
MNGATTCFAHRDATANSGRRCDLFSEFCPMTPGLIDSILSRSVEPHPLDIG